MSLSKFGVPLADGERNGMLQPKQSFKFRVRFLNFGLGSLSRELTQQVVSVTRPTYTQESVPLHSYNSIGYIGGKHEWQEIEVTVRDDITNAIVSAVGAQKQKQINHHEQTSAVSGANYKFTMYIDALDGTSNGQLETWELQGCWLTNVSHPEGDYSNSESNVITMSIRYDNALQLEGTIDSETINGGDPMVNIASPTGGSTFA